MKTIYLAAALLISGAVISTASAAPVAPMSGLTHQAPVIDVQYRHRDNHNTRRHVRPAPRYRAGHRYSSAPRGWHRYSRRPGDWNRRGCVMVGPVWFCP